MNPHSSVELRRVAERAMILRGEQLRARTSPLPPEPDLDAVDEWLVDAHERAWAAMRAAGGTRACS
jgi:hypothetical protein